MAICVVGTQHPSRIYVSVPGQLLTRMCQRCVPLGAGHQNAAGGETGVDPSTTIPDAGRIVEYLPT